ncbi:class I SAM-dependent methyltransferase [Paenibacillus antri]|nr:class I SAM-dependent methyltransferase [Paenibacillus antri]
MEYHEIIAATGAGAAHPGGFGGTLDFLADAEVSPGQRVLEVGCGTGRTSCALAAMGCAVTAVDRSEAMLEKAKRRAALLGATIDFVQGDLRALPFEAASFDIVFAESVTAFAPPAEAYREYARVLRSGGRVWDRELYKIEADAPELDAEMYALYGSAPLPTKSGWLESLKAAGFVRVGVWTPRDGRPFVVGSAELEADPLQFIDLDRVLRPDVAAFTARNAAFLRRFGEALSYGVFIGENP